MALEVKTKIIFLKTSNFEKENLPFTLTSLYVLSKECLLSQQATIRQEAIHTGLKTTWSMTIFLNTTFNPLPG